MRPKLIIAAVLVGALFGCGTTPEPEPTVNPAVQGCSLVESTVARGIPVQLPQDAAERLARDTEQSEVPEVRAAGSRLRTDALTGDAITDSKALVDLQAACIQAYGDQVP